MRGSPEQRQKVLARVRRHRARNRTKLWLRRQNTPNPRLRLQPTAQYRVDVWTAAGEIVAVTASRATNREAWRDCRGNCWEAVWANIERGLASSDLIPEALFPASRDFCCRLAAMLGRQHQVPVGQVWRAPTSPKRR